MKKLLALLRDKDIPFPYLLNYLLCNHFLVYLIGWIKLRRFGNIKCHFSSTVKCPSKIKGETGGGIFIGRKCYIDALSREGIRCKGRVSLGNFTTVMCTSQIGDLGKGMTIGNHSGLGSHGFYGCAGGIEIGENVLIGNFVSMHSENHNFDRTDIPIGEQGVNRKGIKIGNNCWIGAKATFLDGCELGDGCVVAAGAVVRGIIPPNSVIGGVPARILKKRE